MVAIFVKQPLLGHQLFNSIELKSDLTKISGNSTTRVFLILIERIIARLIRLQETSVFHVF